MSDGGLGVFAEEVGMTERERDLVEAARILVSSADAMGTNLTGSTWGLREALRAYDENR